MVQAQSPELEVASPHAHPSHRHIAGDLGVGGLAPHLVPASRQHDNTRSYVHKTFQEPSGRREVREAATCSCPEGAHFRFFRHFFCLPPVRRRLCSESRLMPARAGETETAEPSGGSGGAKRYYNNPQHSSPVRTATPPTSKCEGSVRCSRATYPWRRQAGKAVRGRFLLGWPVRGAVGPGP